MKTYRALVLDDQLLHHRMEGQLTIQPSCLVFENEQHTYQLPLDLLKIELGGTGKRTVYFTHRDYPFSFTTAQKEILNNPLLTSQLSSTEKIAQIKAESKKITYSIYAFGLVCLAALVVLYFSKDFLIRKAAQGVPNSLEATMGRQYIAQLRLLGELDSNSVLLNELKMKAKPLLQIIKTEQNFEIYISNDKEVNAFALPGGFMVFNKGLLQKADSWEEVLGVMGHEIAHVTEKHHSRGLISNIGWTTLLSFFLGDGSALTNIIFGQAAQLESLNYSRGFETEADLKGFEYLQKANIDPKGLRTFFEKLQKIEDDRGVALPQLLSSHPASENRINALNELMGQTEGKTYTNLGDYKNFLKQLNQIDTKKAPEKTKY